MSQLGNRIPGLVLFVFAVIYGLEARGFRVGFLADPIGPSAFPLLLGILMALTAVYLMVYPSTLAQSVGDASLRRGRRRVLSVLVMLLAYPVALPYLGFVVSTTLTLTVAGLMAGRGSEEKSKVSIGRAALAALALSTALFFLGTQGASLPLPIGSLFQFAPPSP